jgi:hypothetical protein
MKETLCPFDHGGLRNLREVEESTVIAAIAAGRDAARVGQGRVEEVEQLEARAQTADEKITLRVSLENPIHINLSPGSKLRITKIVY